MKLLYLNNAATTWPKPKCISETVQEYFHAFPQSTARNGDFHVSNKINMIEQIRDMVKKYFGCDEQTYIAFVPSATIGMNIVIRSIANGRENGHFVTTNAEHHSVYRPLMNLQEKGYEIDIVEYVDRFGNEYPQRILSSLKKNTLAVIMNHASNVTGQVFSVSSIGREIKRYDIPLVIDATQSAGIVPFTFEDICADYLVFSSHKHFYGIHGTGIIIWKNYRPLVPLYYGGTGRNSAKMTQAEDLPWRIEAGSYNLLSIQSLGASLRFCSHKKIPRFHAYEMKLINRFIYECKKISGFISYVEDIPNRLGIALFNIKELDPNFVVAPYLNQKGIVIRSGLHCAPKIHETLGTYPTGANRLSVSILNTMEDIDRTINEIKILAKGIK